MVEIHYIKGAREAYLLHPVFIILDLRSVRSVESTPSGIRFRRDCVTIFWETFMGLDRKVASTTLDSSLSVSVSSR